MTKVGTEPHAALSAHERVAQTRRAADSELAVLRQSADSRRLTLILRDIIDPGERISRATEWRARALSGHDRDTTAASRRNILRFGEATTGLLHDIAALPDWIAPEPPQVREAVHAAGLFSGIGVAFERAAASIRALVVPGFGPHAAPPETPPRPSGMKSFQLPRLVRVTGHNATRPRRDR